MDAYRASSTMMGPQALDAVASTRTSTASTRTSTQRPMGLRLTCPSGAESGVGLEAMPTDGVMLSEGRYPGGRARTRRSGVRRGSLASFHARAGPSVRLGRPVLSPKAALSYRTGEDGDNHQQERDSTTQYPADDYVGHDIAGAVCPWPEMADDPLAQRQYRDVGTE